MIRTIGRSLGVAAVVLVAACSASSKPVAAPSRTSHPTASAKAAPAADTVWLCRPGAATDPCAAHFSVTSISAGGLRRVQPSRAGKHRAVDCFYVYPTVSTEKAQNSDLKIQPAETNVAFDQASPFSQVCRVWAPMYRQVTNSGLIKAATTDRASLDVAYNSVLSAWQDYLAHDNHGRPVVFIGHSQGSSMLIRLLETQIDPNPELRARTVMAILAGGNVAVPTGKTVGSTFQHLPLCSASTRSSCVIAYSSFLKQPPSYSLFGQPGRGVSLLSGQTATSGVQVACVNPAAYGVRSANLTPEFPSAVTAISGGPIDTPWVTFPKLYRSGCRSADGTTWLQVTAHDRGVRPVVSETLGPAWGLHRDDINLALGDLVRDVSIAVSDFR